ncbi:ribonuclease H-like domain-containing protein [Tanacetum coccineum]
MECLVTRFMARYGVRTMEIRGFGGGSMEVKWWLRVNKGVDKAWEIYTGIASSTVLLQRIIDMLHSEFAMTDLGSLKYFLGIFAQLTALACSCRSPNLLRKFLSGLYAEFLAGALQYITLTRADLSYVVQQVCLYMHDPREPHFNALKRILHYAGYPVTQRSTSGYYVFLGDNLLSCSAKRLVTLSQSSAEAEYHGVANVVAETAWIRIVA